MLGKNQLQNRMRERVGMGLEGGPRGTLGAPVGVGEGLWGEVNELVQMEGVQGHAGLGDELTTNSEF